jgi:hypothetical protein
MINSYWSTKNKTLLSSPLNATQRADAIRELAAIFLEQGFKRTDKLLLKLATDVENGVTEDPNKQLRKMLRIYGEEYAGNDSDYARLFKFVSEVIIDSINNLGRAFDNKMIELYPVLHKMNQSQTVLQELALICLRARPLSDKEQYYVTCVMYALVVEGPFDQACRLLYFLYRSYRGKKAVSLAKVNKIELHDLRNNLDGLSKGKSRIAFIGWNDRHLRNAIAHVGLEYIAGNNSMRFSDRRHTETVPWPKFNKYYHLTFGVSFVFLHVMLLVRANNLAFGQLLIPRS